MLRTVADIAHAAQECHYGVGAFGVVSVETALAVLDAAVATRSPVIILVCEDAWCAAPTAFWIDRFKQAADEAPIPVAIALDHGSNVEACIEGVAIGLTGVMYDGSHLPYAENCANSARVAALAHAAGISAEAEIGRVPDGDASEQDVTSYLSDPDQVADFARASGADLLAVAVGTVHGTPLRTPQLDFARIATIRRMVEQPLVLHGCSGTQPADLQRAIAEGIQKLNVYTDMVVEAGRRQRSSMDNGEDIVDWLRAVNKGYHDVSAYYMNLFQSTGQAR